MSDHQDHKSQTDPRKAALDELARITQEELGGYEVTDNPLDRSQTTTSDTPIADRWAGVVATTRRAFLRYVQRGNECKVTGGACRSFKQCGCWLEMEAAIHAEQ